MSDKHERELDAAQAELQKLLDERSTLSAQLAQASDAEVVNVKALIELQKRADEIPKHIFAATVRAQRARITILEHRLVAEQETVQLEIAAANEVGERLLELKAIYTAAVTKRDNARTQVAFTRGDLSVAQRELEREIRANSKPLAPIVRSLPHAA
jgi:bacillopeptidase F (M6 metalloprotease family)